MPKYAVPDRDPGRTSRKIPLEQAREIRLSMETNQQVADRLGVTPNVIQCLRSGTTYGVLQRDERDAHHARRHNSPATKGATGEGPPRLINNMLLTGPAFPVSGRPDLQERFERIESLDAADECSHGRLPHDRTAPCGCWPQEITKTNPMQEDTNGSHHLTRRERFAAQVRSSPALPGRDADHQPTLT